MKFTWVLLDTMSIQQYIFSSNKLKENLGASYLVEDIYDSSFQDAFNELSLNVNSLAWKHDPQKLLITQPSTSVEIGYIGGGNALLFFRDRRQAEEFLKSWTTILLVKAPGIMPATAIEEFELKDAEDDHFSEHLKKLFSELVENKNQYTPQTIISRHGITAECSRTGYSAEIWGDKLPQQDQRYISSVAYAKLNAAKIAKQNMEKELLEETNLSHKYTFTDELEDLGQVEGESHIAIVYIDGNDMGKRFKSQKTLRALRELSISVRTAVKNSVKKLINEFDRHMELFKKDRSFKIKTEGGKYVIPLRPIIIGGDDITFVSEGRIGIFFAQKFMEELENEIVSDGQPITASAGVAIIKTKYPFYRGYELSEELCRFAKKHRKKHGDNGSWIDWQILKGSISGDLERLRQKDYIINGKRLYQRPYELSTFKVLVKATAELSKFPRSKIMKLREMLFKNEADHHTFIHELALKDLKLPAFGNFDGSKLILNNKTPYLDMIELLEFYPQLVLKEEI